MIRERDYSVAISYFRSSPKNDATKPSHPRRVGGLGAEAPLKPAERLAVPPEKILPRYFLHAALVPQQYIARNSDLRHPGSQECGGRITLVRGYTFLPTPQLTQIHFRIWHPLRAVLPTSCDSNPQCHTHTRKPEEKTSLEGRGGTLVQQKPNLTLFHTNGWLPKESPATTSIRSTVSSYELSF